LQSNVSEIHFRDKNEHVCCTVMHDAFGVDQGFPVGAGGSIASTSLWGIMS
jgi:hypothetical protein